MENSAAVEQSRIRGCSFLDFFSCDPENKGKLAYSIIRQEKLYAYQ